MTKKHILITGAMGFIGEHLFRFLHSRPGYLVSGISKPGGLIAEKVVTEVDLMSPDEIAAWKRGRPDIDTIVHLAAQIPEQFSAIQTDDIFFSNLLITRNMLSLAVSEKARFVYLSSSSIYGLNEQNQKLQEDAPFRADNYYTLSKYVGEMLCQRLHQDHGLDFISLRLTSPYGPGQKLRTVIRMFLEAAMRSEDLQIFGSGQRTQDFIYIDDVIQAIWLAIQAKATGIFNIASGASVSMLELAETVIKAVPNTRSRIISGKQPDLQETYRGSFSIEKARQGFNFSPTVTLVEGLHKYMETLK
ncbi:MAG: NAD(P)-dependent oxidoreductase [Anaerolineales bacterium]|nr:NAD(P)-dependent oxidoreductase [Anaerolineales bacterium]